MFGFKVTKVRGSSDADVNIFLFLSKVRTIFQIFESFDIYCNYIAIYVEVCNISTKIEFLMFFIKTFEKANL
jgi:hypothetical protein